MHVAAYEDGAPGRAPATVPLPGHLQAVAPHPATGGQRHAALSGARPSCQGI